MQDPADETKLGELLERRRLSELSEAERLELDTLLERDPAARELAKLLEQEDQAMNETISAAVDRFDFDKARRAIAAKLEADRRWLGLQLVFGLLVVAVVAVMVWRRGDWGAVLSTAAAMALGVLYCLWVVVRRRALVRSASAGGAALEGAYHRHVRNGRGELVILRALMILGGLGFVVLLIDSIVNGSYVKAALVLLGIVVFGPIVARRVFTRSALARHERFLSGDLSGSAWMRGEDGPR